ncbi:MAG: adenosine deaminase [Gammaproteobacteria bacterium]|nr:adenosine deaminase [Gammaproteobacteria bacterium]
MHEDAIELAKSLPKAELHMHLEGALQPELIFKFVGRNGRDLPYRSIEELRAKYEFTNLQDFINVYLVGFNSLASAEDYEDLANDYCEHAQAENITHAEVFIEAQAGSSMTGTPLEAILGGCIRAAEEWKKRGVELLLIPTFLRHLSENEALKSLDELEPYYDNIVGIGLASAEVGFPPENFRRLFDLARELGLHTVAHAGEEGPPEYVWGALDDLGVERIDHGNRAIEDPVLVSRLARDQIPLTMCPLSNLRLCVVDDLRNHPLKKFLDAGIKATVNSDDPAYFGGYLNTNFEEIIKALNLSTGDVRELVQNAHDASFEAI